MFAPAKLSALVHRQDHLARQRSRRESTSQTFYAHGPGPDITSMRSFLPSAPAVRTGRVPGICATNVSRRSSKSAAFWRSPDLDPSLAQQGVLARGAKASASEPWAASHIAPRSVPLFHPKANRARRYGSRWSADQPTSRRAPFALRSNICVLCARDGLSHNPRNDRRRCRAVLCPSAGVSNCSHCNRAAMRARARNNPALVLDASYSPLRSG